MKAKFFTSIALLAAAIIMLFSSSALAIDCDACSGNNNTNLSTQEAIQCGTSCATGNNQDANQATTNVNSTLSTLISTLSLFVGAIAVIMLVIGGFRYVTSGGKQESVTSAKNTIVYALVGLIIVALAQIIVHFVLNKVSDSTSGTNKPSNAKNSPGP